MRPIEAFRRRNNKMTAPARSATRARAPMTIPAMAPLLSAWPSVDGPELWEGDAEGIRVCGPESLDGIVMILSRAPSTQEHCETLKRPRS